MKVLTHAPIFLSILVLLGGQSVSAAALDKAIRDILKTEAAETSLQKGTFVKELVPEPSTVPNEQVDFQALENSITIQIKQAISKNASETATSDGEQNALELALENVVASALIRGNKLDDIRNAVAAAMSDIQDTSALEEQIPTNKIQSAASALKEIVSESTQTTEGSPQGSYIESLRAELTIDKPATNQPRNAVSAVDMILATMSETQQVTQNTLNPVAINATPEAKSSAALRVPVRPLVETVTVLRGETLFKIAKRVYGSGEKYLALYEANKGTISNPNMIFVGQVLKVPR